MFQISIKKNENRPEIISQIVDFLRDGAMMVLPTDTIYGFSCRADDDKTIKRIYKAKQRSARKPFIILVSSLAMAKKYVHISKKNELILKKYWYLDKRPTTVILNHRGLLPESLTGGQAGLALRLPKSDFLIKIIKKINTPLVSTSLNISGKESLNQLSELSLIWPSKSKQPDLVVNSGKPRSLRPSRLIDLRGLVVNILRK